LKLLPSLDVPPDQPGRRSPLKDEEVDTLEDYSRSNPDAFRAA
jgi:hypothetical protein